MWNNFPYTNFHELNADWILEQVKRDSDFVKKFEEKVRETIGKILAEMDLPATVAEYMASAKMIHSDEICTSLGNFSEYRPDLKDLTVSEFFGLWDLIPGLTRKEIAKTGDSTQMPVYMYTHRADIETDGGVGTAGNRWEAFTTLAECFPRLILVSAIHGDEKASAWALYCFIKHIMEDDSPEGLLLRSCIELNIVPIINPYGFEHNTRNNESNVNLNRNFPPNWENYEAADKGRAPLCETESRAIAEIIEDNVGNAGAVLLDFHDFEFINHEDRHVCWFSAGQRAFRMNLAQTMEAIKNEYDSRDLPAYEVFSRFGLPSDSPTMDRYAYEKGLTGTLCECPQKIFSDSIEYERNSDEIAFLIVSNVITRSARFCFDIKQRTIYARLEDIGADLNTPLAEVVRLVPSGCLFKCVLYAKNGGALFSSLPQHEENVTSGMLEVQKVYSKTGESSVITWTTTAGNNSYQFFTSTDSEGKAHPWKKNGIQNYTGDDEVVVPSTVHNLRELITTMKTGDSATLFLSSSSFVSLHGQMPTEKAGILRVEKTRSRASGSVFCVFDYTTTGYKVPERWFTSAQYDTDTFTLRDWQKINTAEQ